jgi:alkylation response protein AidB-like acyl-CoA dehydrogenase
MMEIGPNDDQRALADSAREVLAEQAPLSLTRASYDDPEAWHPLWQTVVDLGWTGVLAADPDPDELRNLIVLMEAAGHAAVPAPLLSTVGLAAGALWAVRPESRRLLDEIAEGGRAALLAVAPEVRLPGTCLALDNNRVSGRIAQARDLARSDFVVAIAEDSIGHANVVAFRTEDQLTISPLDAVDPSQPLSSATITATPEFVAQVDLTHALVVPLIAAAAELVGVGSRAVAMSVDYAKTREQFGQPIGAFQAVKHRITDSYVAVERARSLTYAAAAAVATTDPSAYRTAMLAKAAASEAATGAGRACVATHGAIAQTWEHDAHLLVRRAWQSAALMGESEALFQSAARDYLTAVTA